MKKLTTLLAWFFMGITAFTLTSCLNDDDDDDKSITPEQALAYMRQADGNYVGNVRFQNDTVTTNATKVDSVGCALELRASDSTIVMRNVEPRMFSKLLNGSTHQKLRAAVDQLPLQTLKLRHIFNSAYESGLLSFGVYPLNFTLNVDVEGEMTKVEYIFYTYMNANGEYYNNQVLFNFFVQEIKINGVNAYSYSVSNNYVDNNCVFNVYGTRLGY